MTTSTINNNNGTETKGSTTAKATNIKGNTMKTQAQMIKEYQDNQNKGSSKSIILERGYALHNDRIIKLSTGEIVPVEKYLEATKRAKAYDSIEWTELSVDELQKMQNLPSIKLNDNGTNALMILEEGIFSIIKSSDDIAKSQGLDAEALGFEEKLQIAEIDYSLVASYLYKCIFQEERELIEDEFLSLVEKQGEAFQSNDGIGYLQKYIGIVNNKIVTIYSHSEKGIVSIKTKDIQDEVSAQTKEKITTETSNTNFFNL